MYMNNILIESRYEFKRTRRNILFNIFAILAILGLVIYQFTFLSQINDISSIKHLFHFYIDWPSQALPSAIPFKTAYYFNIIQLFLVIVFIMNDSRLLKLNAMNVLYVYPRGNGEIVLGNFLGKLFAFTMITCISFVISTVINLVLYPKSFEFSYYFFYWTTLTLPALICFLGISYFVMRFIHHQGLSMLILFLVLGGGTWWGDDFLHGMLDPCARHVPNMFSDFIGHVNLGNYLFQRVFFILIGFAFLVLSIISYPRIPNHIQVYKKYLSITCVLFVLAGGVCFIYYKNYQSNYNARKLYMHVYEKYSKWNEMRVLRHDLHLRELDNGEISVNSRMKVINTSSMETPLILYLNPSLNVLSIKVNGEEIFFSREHQTLLLNKELKNMETCEISMYYEGGIENGICFLDVDPVKYNSPETNSHGIYYYGYSPAFCEKEYKLFTPECIWYPVCVPPYHVLGCRNVNFTRFSLEVEHDSLRTAISQGEFIEEKNGATKFSFTHDMPGISLCVGNYKKRMIMVDSTRVELYCLPSHDYLLEGYDFPNEPLAQELLRVKQSLETTESVQTSEYKVKTFEGEKVIDPVQQYPYRWLTLLEVPCNYHCFSNLMQLTGEREQGGIVFLPEKGFSLDYQYYVPRNEEEKLSRLEWIYSDIDRILGKGSCDIKPIFRSKTSFIFSDEYPIMNNILAEMAREVFGMQSEPVEDYPVIEYLKDKSLKDALHDNSLSPAEIKNIIRKKSVELHKYIMLYIGEEQFQQFYHDFLANNLFKETTLNECFHKFYESFGIKLDSLVERWYNANQLPLFEIKDALAIMIGETDISFIPDIMYSFKVYNRGDVPGLIMTGDYQGWIIPPHEGKAIKIRNRKDNTNISSPYLGMPMAQNLPSYVSLERVDLKHVIDTVACECGLTFPIDVPNCEEIIVDNEDPGFRVVTGDKFSLVSLLRGTEARKQYYNNFTQDKWLPAISERFYGSPVQSAYYKTAGVGDQKVEWNVYLPQEGKYEVFFYNTRLSDFMKNSKGAELHYSVFDGKEEHEVIISVNTDEIRWVSLGVFEFSRNAKVILSDKDRCNRKDDKEFSSPQKLVADAVKWVKR